MIKRGWFQSGAAGGDEATLVAKAQGGDRTAFEALFHKYKGRMYSLCYRLANDRAEAEDWTQEVFLQLYRKINTFRGESPFATWLHRLATNTALMQWRKRSGDLWDEWPDPAEELPAFRTPSVTHRSLDRIRLERALGSLPGGYRTVLVLHDVEGYDHQEIADMLGCTTGTSKSQLHKARLKLREILTEP